MVFDLDDYTEHTHPGAVDRLRLSEIPTQIDPETGLVTMTPAGLRASAG